MLTLRSLVLTTLATFSTQPPVSAQEWTQRALVPAPGPRTAQVTVYDSARQQIVIFGGRDFATLKILGDTWTYDGAAWRQHTPSPAPAARNWAAATFDAARGVVMLFGGITDNGCTSETWEWDGSAWRLRTPVHAPAPLAGHTMAFDPLRQRVLLFGGAECAATGAYQDHTWEWDGTDWLELAPPTRPSARTDAMLAFDGRGLLLFGGLAVAGSGTTFSDETWRFDGIDWRKLSPTNVPPARTRAAFAYDARRDRVVMFGGQGSNGAYSPPDTWEWNGADWSRHALLGPGPRSAQGGAAYDARREQVVLFGGFYQTLQSFRDLWELGSAEAVFPARDYAAAGSAQLELPFGAPRARLQFAMHGSAFYRTRVGSLRTLMFRRERGTDTYAARRLFLGVLLGTPAMAPKDLSLEFATNWSTPPTLVLATMVDLPALPPAPEGLAGSAPRIDLATPYPWNGGDLLCELVVDQGTASPYVLDADLQRFGSARAFGGGCSQVGAPPTQRLPNESQLVTGGTFDQDLLGATPLSIALAVLGQSDQQWGATQLPFTLPGTSCTIYTDLAIGAPLFTSPLGTAGLRWPIPSDPALIGASFFSQWAVAEGPAQTGLTHALRLTIGESGPVLFDSIANTTLEPIGQKLSSGHIVPVVRWELQ